MRIKTRWLQKLLPKDDSLHDLQITDKDLSEDWYCKEFNRRIWIEIKESELLGDIVLLPSFMLERETSDFDFKDCAFIGEDRKAFFPEQDRGFLTEDCDWYIKPPKNFYVYFDRVDKYNWEDHKTVGLKGESDE